MLGLMRKHLVIAGLAVCLALGGSVEAPWSGPSTAEAAVSVAHTLEELVDQSRWAVLGSAKERVSNWEEVAGSRRIVTYTRVEVSQIVFGKGLEKSVWVRTLGGAVDRIGQQVSGQAELRLGQRALLFLSRTPSGAVVVSGAAQGHFPIAEPKKAVPKKAVPRKEGESARLGYSPSMGKVMPRKGPSISVHEVLIGLEPKAAVAKIREVKALRDALRRKK